MNYYEIYDSSGNNLLAKGTARECRKMLGRSSLNTFYKMVGDVLCGKNKKYKVVKINGPDTEYPVLGKDDPLYEKYWKEHGEQECDDTDD